jgi:ATP-dependent Lon protease
LRDDVALNVPERLPALPLRDVVLFPWAVMPLLVGRAASLAALSAAGDDGLLLVVAQRDPETAEPGAADLHRIGTVARLRQGVPLANGTMRVLLEGIARVRVTRFGTRAGSLRATVEPYPLDAGVTPDALEALSRRVATLFDEYVALQRRLPAEVASLAQADGSVERRACAVAAHLAVRHDVRQGLLEAASLPGLLSRLAELLRSELEMLGLERKIEDEVRGAVVRNQREFFLNEQLKAIHRELGAEDGDELSELEEHLAKKSLPAPVRERAMRELRKLRRTPPTSPEGTVGRNFLDWIIALPWTERTDDVLDLARARAILDAEHHGLDEVKERILDYLAALTLAGSLGGPLLCLAGPPGVGKTSLGRAVARSLGRRFVRVSLGGVRDEAEIRGHRRTYIGAMPGRILQGMRRAETVNPVFLLDELDKLGTDWRGDPAAALLEVLDAEQHKAFSDHYLELDYDLSHVLFITTANTLGGIPEPLRDRLEVLRLPGYVDQEKLAIARKHLVPKQLAQHGIPAESVAWESDALAIVMRRYTREAGVRELERRIARIARKLARQRVGANLGADATGQMTQTVRADELEALLGVPPYEQDDQGAEDRVGVASGLAYTNAGGERLDIEVSIVPGRGRLQLTGTLGDVMKESASAALSYVRARAVALGIDRDFPKGHDIHVHIPAGATPKDGPSAGIAIATALVSAITGTPVRGDVALTGEITLRGRVLSIGGLKEKAVAAHRHGLRHVVIPAGNARDVEEIPSDVRAGTVFHPVKSMDEALTLALREAPSVGATHGAAAGDHIPVPPPTAH